MEDRKDDNFKESLVISSRKSLTLEQNTYEPVKNVEEIQVVLDKSPKAGIVINLDENNEKIEETYEDVAMAFHEASVDRKKNALNLFKRWEDRRANLLSIHRRRLEIIIYRLDGRSNMGTQCIEMLIEFFKERSLQEEAYHKFMTSTIPKLGQIFREDKPEESVLGVFPKAFIEFDEYHSRHTKNNQDIAQFITFAIINEILDWLKKDYVKKIESFRSSLLEIKKRLAIINKETQEKCNEYGEYSTKLIKNGFNDKSKDFYERQLGFMQLIETQMKLESELGKEIMRYFDELKKLEKQRLEVIKDAIGKYMRKMGEIFGREDPMNPDIVLKLLEMMNINEDVEKFFRVQTFFDLEEDIKFLKEMFPKASEITLTEMRAYVEIFNFKQPNRNPLIMKEWNVVRDMGLLKGNKNYRLISTVDYNLILAEENEGILKPEKVIKMNHIDLLLNERNDSSGLVFVEVVPGLIMKTKNKFIIRFENGDLAEEFIHFIKNYEIVKEANNNAPN